MRRELLGEDHPEVGRTLLNLASLQYDRGETREALANMRKCWRFIARRILRIIPRLPWC